MLWTVAAICTSARGTVYAPSALNWVRKGTRTRQYGLSGAVRPAMFSSGSARRTSQMSVRRRPVLMPPWTSRPFRRAVACASTPCQFSICLPYLSANVSRLLVWPKRVGTTSYRPLIRCPPPSGNRESDGATTLKDSKSDGDTARLSVTRKLPYQRRKYPTSIDTFGRSWCWTLTEPSQLYSRFPHPLRMSGSYVVLGMGLPNARLLIWPHSPLSNGLSRSQSGLKLTFVSVHARLTDCTVRFAGLAVSPNVPV